MLSLSLNHKSRMRRESHVRFCERWGGKFPLPTRPIPQKSERVKSDEQEGKGDKIQAFDGSEYP